MQPNWKTWAGLAAAVVALGGLAGCNDNNDDNDNVQTPTDTTRPPSSAAASTSAFVSYLNGLPQSDTAEPLLLDQFTPPTDDTAEPTPLT